MNALATAGGGPLMAQAMTPEQVALLKRTVAAGTTDDEFALFLAMAQRAGLDPFQRQIYAVKRWSKRDSREVMTVQTGIDGLRLIAQRTGEYLGQTPPEWCGDDGVWRSVWLSNNNPAAARIGVYKRGNEHPTVRVATWASFAQKGHKDGKSFLTGLWATMGPEQLLKCAEAQALRAAFPNDLSGIYAAEEMGQAENVPAVTMATTAPRALPDASQAAEPVPTSWVDGDEVASSFKIVGTVTLVEPTRDSKGAYLRLTIVDEGGDSAQYVTRKLSLQPVAEAACTAGALIEARFVIVSDKRRIVAMRDPLAEGGNRGS